MLGKRDRMGTREAEGRRGLRGGDSLVCEEEREGKKRRTHGGEEQSEDPALMGETKKWRGKGRVEGKGHCQRDERLVDGEEFRN